jgi:hypothetical protein
MHSESDLAGNDDCGSGAITDHDTSGAEPVGTWGLGIVAG